MKSKISESDIPPDITEIVEIEESDSSLVEIPYIEEEALLAQILQYYEASHTAYIESDFGLAETKIDSAFILSIKVDLGKIDNESLVLRFKDTLALLSQEYGNILFDSYRISQEDPSNWLHDLTDTDPVEFKNGRWTDDELRRIVHKIALKCDVPIDYNEKVKNVIYYFQTKGRKTMTVWLKRSERYLPLLREILEEKDLPLDLAYISMIESGFSPKAYSKARAMGLWQFISSTGRLYGLNRTQWLDERRDPVKSTKAAAQHLKDLYKLYNDWKLVMAAYNCGAARVTRYVQRSEYPDFWSMNLPSETKNYVPSFMAAVIISKAPDIFGFENIEYDLPLEYDTVEVHPYTSISKVARTTGINKESIRILNPELLGDRTPAGKSKYPLNIPKGTSEKFIAEYSKMPVDVYKPPVVGTHYVKRYETLSHISRKYGVSVSRLMAANKIKNPRKLRIGQKLNIPNPSKNVKYTSSYSGSPSSKKRITDPINGTFKYKIKKNDSLWLLAEKYNTTVATMQSINNMRRRTKIVPGNTLLIPNPVDFKKDEVTKTSSGQIIYIIQKNDTLYEIAEKYGVSHRDIMKWNNITNHRKIKPGQKIVIPPSLLISSGQITYIIRKNDTLYEIAEKYGVSHRDIMKWNKIKNHRKIKPGQKIIIIAKK